MVDTHGGVSVGAWWAIVAYVVESIEVCNYCIFTCIDASRSGLSIPLHVLERCIDAALTLT